jgi:CDP-diglyceride synthetase
MIITIDIIILLCSLFVAYRLATFDNAPTLADTMDRQTNHRWRLLTALFYVPYMSLMLTQRPRCAQWFVVALSFGAAREFLRVTEFGAEKARQNLRWSAAASSLWTTLLCAFGAHAEYAYFGACLSLGFVVYSCVALVELIAVLDRIGAVACRDHFVTVATRCFGALWIGCGLSHGVRLIGSGPSQSTLALIMLLTSWLGDAAGFYFGRRFGGRVRIMRPVSPGKSLVGCVAVVLFSIVLCAATWWLSSASPAAAALVGALHLPTLSLGHYMAIGALVGVAGIFGDALESLAKRAGGVKDSGQFFVGHGGILDRFDALLLCSPLLFFYNYYLL